MLLLLVFTMISAICISGITAFSASQNTTPAFFRIINPYENVDWNTFGQYKAALHVHSTRSDGQDSKADMISEHYIKGFDVIDKIAELETDDSDRPKIDVRIKKVKVK